MPSAFRLALSLASLLGTVQMASSAVVFNYSFSADEIGASGVPITADADGVRPVGDSTDGDPGPSSFISEVTGNAGATLSGLYFDVNALFQTSGLTMADITGITFETKADTQAGNWTLTIYTKPNGNDGSGFYNNRFTAQTPDGTGSFTLSDANTAGYFVRDTTQAGGTGAINIPISESLAQLSEDPSIGAEPILYYLLLAGATANTLPVMDNLDGITLTRANGDVVNIDLIPEPSSAMLGGFAVFCCGSIRLRRRELVR